MAFFAEGPGRPAGRLAHKQLEEVQKLVTFPVGTTATKEDVKNEGRRGRHGQEIATKTY